MLDSAKFRQLVKVSPARSTADELNPTQNSTDFLAAGRSGMGSGMERNEYLSFVLSCSELPVLGLAGKAIRWKLNVP